MSHNIACFRCGAALASLLLPLSRREACPECSAHLHVCRMCRNFDATVPAQCLEEDAEDVSDKERQNFCDWFVPSEDAFNPATKEKADEARQSLEVLFGESETVSDASDTPPSDADKLFD
ncbi:MAG: hypothetical protein KAJ57_09785 [Woeseiaceae bacterium]|nr:hypothetical protein [Woeseiaceae bacterium]